MLTTTVKLYLFPLCWIAVFSTLAGSVIEVTGTTFDIPDGDVAALIDALDSARDGDVINLAENGLYTLTDVDNRPDPGSSGNGLPVIRYSIAIRGQGSIIERDRDAPFFRIFTLEEVGPDASLVDLTIKYGMADRGGGMLNVKSRATVSNCGFVGNRASRGGAIYNHDSDVAINESRFEENRSFRGGGIFNLLSNTLISHCIFVDNRVTEGGGGIYNVDSSPMITDCDFRRNRSDAWAGGMENRNSHPTIVDTLFEGNWAYTKGGELRISLAVTPSSIR